MKENRTKTKKTNKKFSLVLLIILIIVIALGVILFLNNSNNEKGKNVNEQMQESNQQVDTGLIDMNNTDNAKVENGIKENIAEDVLKDRTIGNIQITEIQLQAQDGVSHFIATVKNKSSKKFTGAVAKISFTNKDGSDYAELEVYIPEMEANGINSINAATTSDIINAYNFTIELEK